MESDPPPFGHPRTAKLPPSKKYISIVIVIVIVRTFAYCIKLYGDDVDDDYNYDDDDNDDDNKNRCTRPVNSLRVSQSVLRSFPGNLQ